MDFYKVFLTLAMASLCFSQFARAQPMNPYRCRCSCYAVGSAGMPATQLSNETFTQDQVDTQGANVCMSCIYGSSVVDICRNLNNCNGTTVDAAKKQISTVCSDERGVVFSKAGMLIPLKSTNAPAPAPAPPTPAAPGRESDQPRDMVPPPPPSDNSTPRSMRLPSSVVLLATLAAFLLSRSS